MKISLYDIMNGLAAVAVLWAMWNMQKMRLKVLSMENRIDDLERKVKKL